MRGKKSSIAQNHTAPGALEAPQASGSVLRFGASLHPDEYTMSGPKYLGFDTLSLHAGAAPDPATGARATPIYLTTSYVFKDSDHAAALFNMERAGHVYSRISNPTNAVLEERIAALEGGVAGIAVASGQAAMHLGLATIAGAGSHVV